ncbi:MAG: sigma-70 region 4 domain-containing protein [Bacteroidales bacterium]|nr:sigma-70 region 4 domain-containing protein [Bacteroidales bacterium]MBQ2913581.1 sigma-70 region 4 domain-containing protein [Bacteroidales bacterium]MBQ7018571.1 sigma-70 region 4 domain-containing protein [Bacteroidales bacterium]MBR2478735.1 sigma-70 region 4 domain-containing protein [Bacteroidales bacterium]
MDPIYTDTLKTLMVYKYELEAAVVELERISHHNTILYCIIAALIAGAVIGAYWLGRIHSRRLNAEKFANRLLIKHAENLPLLANEVNKISGKNIKLSETMYDELQGAITKAKAGSRSGIVEVVNDSEFIRTYPFIKGLDFLSPQEKLVLILTEEGHPVQEIALYTGGSDSSVRAMKSRIRTKIEQAENISPNYLKLKIFKKSQI